MWQDFTLMIVAICLNIAMLPQIIKGFKAKKKMMASSTTLITVIGIFIVGFVYLSLNLYFSAVLQLIGGILWLILFIQSIIYKN